MTSAATEVDRFTGAVAGALRYLKEQTGMGAWMVLRRHGDDAIVLATDDSAFGLTAHQAARWSESLCSHMVAGRGPNVATDIGEVPAFLESAGAAALGVRAYVGVPILLGSGELFGTLCGIDRERQPDELHRTLPLVQVFAELLGRMIDVELQLDSEHRRLEQAPAMSTLDPPTGLANALGWDEQLDREEERCRSHGTSGAVVIVELDDLERRVELHGQEATDLYVQAAASAIVATIERSQLAAHLTAGRFGVVLLGVTPNEVTQIERQIHKALLERSVAASVGSAMRKPATGMLGAVAEADAALLQAQRLRAVGDGVSDAGVAPLREALKHGAIRAYFQPIVDLATTDIVSLEALARWVTGDGVREPAAFMPLVQRAGKLRLLFERILDDSLAQLQELRHLAPALTVSVNLEFGPDPAPGLHEFVMSRLHHHQLPPEALSLEMGERNTVDVRADVRVELERLAAAGVQLVLDDFGTGFASRDTLRALPIAAVKIDRRFVSQLANDERQPEAVRAMIAVATAAGVQVKAAGIETRAQLDRLLELGVTQGQGYHLFLPQPPESLSALVSASLSSTWSASVA